MDSSNGSDIINLTSGNELRFVLENPNQKIILKLLDGSAEVFGSELQINEDYEFSYFSSVTVFTLHGCTLKLTNKGSKYCKYKTKASEEIIKMRDLHEYLEKIRVNADKNNTDCPITLITGPVDVGKSTLCRCLLNYASRQGRQPIFIDLDVGQSSLSITGTFGVLPVYEPSDANGKFNEKALSVYYYGYKSPGHNMMLYKLLLNKLGKRLKTRLSRGSHNFKSSGVIIDTCGWIDGQGYKLIIEIIKKLDVNVVFVMEDNFLYSKLNCDLTHRTKLEYVPKIKGVVSRNKNVRSDNRNSCVYEYFYGLSRPLLPHTIKVNFSDLHIFKANFQVQNKSNSQNRNVISVPVEPCILYQVFGLSYAEHVDDIPLTSVFGFICLIELDMDSKVASVLSPQVGPLPTKKLLMGDITLNT